MNRHNVTPQSSTKARGCLYRTSCPQYHQRITCGSASRTTLCIVNQTDTMKAADKTNLNCFTQRYTGPAAVFSPCGAWICTHAHTRTLNTCVRNSLFLDSHILNICYRCACVVVCVCVLLASFRISQLSANRKERPACSLAENDETKMSPLEKENLDGLVTH